MTDKKYKLYCTPKAASKLQIDKLPSPYNDIDTLQIIPNIEIYMNMVHSSWTEEECDDMIYIVSS
jgi:hypothetical protein